MEEEGEEEDVLKMEKHEREEEEFEVTGISGKKGRRGPDLVWEDFQQFENVAQFELSDIPALLERDFSMRSGKLSSRETYYCKWLRKRGYNCNVKIRVIYAESSDQQVIVQKVGGDHRHEDDSPEEVIDHKLRWTEDQTNIVMTAVVKGASPTVIRKLLIEKFPDTLMFSAVQLSNKIAYCRQIVQNK